MVKKPLRSLPITPLVTGYIKPQVVHTAFFFGVDVVHAASTRAYACFIENVRY